MTEVNKDFIKAMQKRLDEKEDIFVGKLNYKNMSEYDLTTQFIDHFHEYFKVKKDINALVDLANFCWMLWEKEVNK